MGKRKVETGTVPCGSWKSGKRYAYCEGRKVNQDNSGKIKSAKFWDKAWLVIII